MNYTRWLFYFTRWKTDYTRCIFHFTR